MKRHQQSYKTRSKRCENCGEVRTDVEHVSDNIWPGGGDICADCILICAARTNRIGDT
jgi:hypothetical protein